MSPPRPETIHVQFTVEDGVNASWDEEKIGALVRSIIARELSSAPSSSVLSTSAKPDDTSTDPTPAAAIYRTSDENFSLPHRQGASEAQWAEPTTIALHPLGFTR